MTSRHWPASLYFIEFLFLFFRVVSVGSLGGELLLETEASTSAGSLTGVGLSQFPSLLTLMVIPFGSSSMTFTLTDLILSVIFSTYTGCRTWEHFSLFFLCGGKKMSKIRYFIRFLVEDIFNIC